MALTYEATLEYLYSMLPMYQREGAAAYRADLGNIVGLCAALDDPHRKLRCIHVGGTNGKGSVSHLTAATLQCAGFRTGLYTSPHLVDFRERIKVNGHMIPKRAVTHFVGRIRPLIESIRPSFFEVTVAMAFDHFVNEHVEVAVIEVGMGGRLDSTNIISPILSVITNIGLDHTQFLGDTHALIAAEKAGIIKPGCPVVIGQRREDTDPVFVSAAHHAGAPVTFATDRYSTIVMRWHMHDEPVAELDILNRSDGSVTTVRSQLLGAYQAWNIPTFLSVIDNLKATGMTLSDHHVNEALAHVCNITGLQGRWQILHRQPMVILESAHNADGLREAMRQLAMTPHGGLHMVIGAVNDKDISSMLAMMPKDATYYFCRPDIPRGLDAAQLAQKGRSAGLSGTHHLSVAAAYGTALDSAQPDDLIYVGGSMFIVAEVLRDHC